MAAGGPRRSKKFPHPYNEFRHNYRGLHLPGMDVDFTDIMPCIHNRPHLATLTELKQYDEKVSRALLKALCNTANRLGVPCWVIKVNTNKEEDFAKWTICVRGLNPIAQELIGEPPKAPVSRLSVEFEDEPDKAPLSLYAFSGYGWGKVLERLPTPKCACET